ncbi:MAG: hypothetical protein Q9160_003706 [Pyrenula sp. 1 TL-2023]
MSETCIVCLGDLGAGVADLQPPVAAVTLTPPRNSDEDEVPRVSVQPPQPGEGADTSLIAHLQPCGHNLHDDCLTPWVERANSCPICRQSFNLVELSKFVGGPTLSAYPVDDRIQEAEIDPSMLLELDADPDSQPCQICREDDNEDVLMYCDNCNKLYHTYCVGLQEVPIAHWFCEQCQDLRRQPSSHGNHGQGTYRPANRRTRGQQRRHRTQQYPDEQQWASVWRSVWDRISFDLDDPFDEDDTAATAIRRQRAQEDTDRREYRAWQRRAQIAELQGGANRFRDTAQALLEPRTGRPPHQPASPEPETLDEVRAWRAFERARTNDERSANNHRKRKSATASPVEHEPLQREGRLKRPRLRRPQDLAENSDSAAESSVNPRPPVSPPPVAQPQRIDISSTGPSFLQSLLKEVESSSAPGQRNEGHGQISATTVNAPTEHSSPRPSSPELSPVTSNAPTPRYNSITPPPLSYQRPISPTAQTPSLQSMYSQNSPDPASGETSDSDAEKRGRSRRLPNNSPPSSRVPEAYRQSSPPGRARSSESSPTRPQLSFTAKKDVQKMVSGALKPHYSDQAITKEEYTTINRDVSRMLYDRVGNFEALDLDSKAKWEKVASDEVSRAVERLRHQAPVVANSVS